jgi:two-component system CheB/CheR fusion protein
MANAETDPEFEALLEYLQRNRGFDFTGYKRTSLMRRINKRMEMVGAHDYGDYVDYIKVHLEEFALLFNTILINVTNFFRDQPAWDFLAQDVLPRMLEARPPNGCMRVWCAGVASGEEAYSLATLLAEAMGPEAFLARVKIYATDVDDESLSQARLASYSEENMESVPAELRSKYFERVNSRYLFRTDLRRAVIFGRHDLIQDAPISRLDLLICRNTLMYFNLETQSRILHRFHFALNDSGFLFLGKAEMLLTHPDLFSPIDLRYRLFSKVPKPEPRDRLLHLARNGEEEANTRLTQSVRVREAAFDAVEIAQVVVDLNGTLVLANRPARSLFGLRTRDVGRPFYELELSYRPVELRSRIDQAYDERQPVLIPEVEHSTANGELHHLDVQVTPLEDNGAIIGVTLTFTDIARRHQLQEEIQRSKQGLETAYEELQSANEELETTNEELQSAVEELQMTNQELQSTNEELETTNKELCKRTGELDQSNAFLESVLASLQAAVIVEDSNLNVVEWNRKAEDFWGLRAKVHMQSFFNLDIGLPVEQLRNPIRACLAGENPEPVVVQATNCHGKTIRSRITFSPLLGPRLERRGVILMMEEMSATDGEGAQFG